MFFKLEKFIFFALVFSIPFQKRFFLFGPSPEGGGFLEWNSGFFYFTDFLVAALAVIFALSFLPRLSSLRRQGSRVKISWIPASAGMTFLFLFVFLAFAFISLTQADLIGVGLYRFIKLGEFIFLFLYVGARAGAIGVRPILQVFVASGVFQSILAILQFAKQSSLGLEIFHESILEIGMKGVAQISANGLDMIRAYGTFPSPNVLAGFLGICLLLLFYLFLSCRGSQYYFLAHSRPPSGGLRGSGCFGPPWADTLPKQPSNPPENNTAFVHASIFFEKYLISLTIFILSFGLILTFSRGVIIFFILTNILFFAGTFIFRQFEKYKKAAIHLLILVVSCQLLVVGLALPEISSRFLGSSLDESAIQERLFFNGVGASTLGQDYTHMLFGVGIGNFVNNFMHSMSGLPYYLYQPVHNIFILIASETGSLGLFAFTLFIAILIERAVKNFFAGSIQNFNDRGNFVCVYTLLCVVAFMMLISMYDHYFWTLQQGSLMFWIALGLLSSSTKSSSSSI